VVEGSGKGLLDGILEPAGAARSQYPLQ